MALDIPRVEYDNPKKTDKPKNLVADPDSIKLQEEANRKARERRERRGWKEVKLSELNTNTQTNTES